MEAHAPITYTTESWRRDTHIAANSHIIALAQVEIGELVGDVVGELVGIDVGEDVGTCVGESVGEAVGDFVGELVGIDVGARTLAPASVKA